MQIKDWKFDASHVKSWADEGKKAGQFVQGAMETAEQSVRDMLLTVAQAIAGTPSINDFLTGYGTAWSNENTAKSRKSDAKAVMDAFAMKNDKGEPLTVERVVGYERDDSGVYKKDANGDPIAIKLTKSVRDWLLEYDFKEGIAGKGSKDGYQGFLTLARELKNQGSGRASQGSTVSRKTKVTEGQFNSIMENVPVMSTKQAATTIGQALAVVAKAPGGEFELVFQLEQVCNKLKASNNGLFVEAAARIQDVLNDLREQIAAQQKLVKEALANTSGIQSEFVAPIPAQKTGTHG